MEFSESQILHDILPYIGPIFCLNKKINSKIIIKIGPILINRIKKKIPELCSDQFRIQCVQFIIQYYTTKMFLFSPFKQKNFKKEQIKDLEYAWKLINLNFKNLRLQTIAILLKIELGQRLEKSDKLAKALDQINFKQNEVQFQMITFTAAPLVGRWKLFLDIGKKLPSLAFEQFNQVAQSMPVPDYSILFKIAFKEKINILSIPDPKKLPWKQFYIELIQVKFKKLNCGKFKNKKIQILKEIGQNEKIFWEKIPNPNSIHLRRMGAIYQCISFSEIPQQLVGIFYENEVKLQGKTQTILGPESEINKNLIQENYINYDSNKIQILVQEEIWDLKRDKINKEFFKGIYIMYNYVFAKHGEKLNDSNKGISEIII